VGRPGAPRKIAALAAAALLAASPAVQAGEAAKSIEEITVLGRRPDADKILRDFVHDYAAPSPYMDQIARWRTAVCPTVVGLSPSFAAFVVRRIEEVAVLVKAGPKPRDKCRPNVRILFSKEPQTVLDYIRRKAPVLLGARYVAQQEELATFRHPIQAWYASQTADFDGQVIDPGATCDLFPGEPPIPGPCVSARGSLFGPGFRSEFAAVTIVVDAGKIAGVALGALSDYLAILALAQTQAFETCQTLPSIANLWSADCDASRKVNALSSSDIAYLRAIYQITPDLPGSVQEDAVAKWMKKNLGQK
jgi:hypothetical protein